MGDKVNFCVPTGNFGDILAADYAGKAGLPVGKLICASNENNVLTDFIETGKYDISGRSFFKTISPSMDILISSNLERLLFDLSGCVQREHCVLKGVALRMIQRILRRFAKRCQLRKPDIQRVCLLKHAEKDIRMLCHQQRFFHFSIYTRAAERIKRHAAHAFYRRLIRHKIESRGKLCSSQHPKRVLLKLAARHSAQHTVP